MNMPEQNGLKAVPVRILLISRDFGLIDEICNLAQPMRIFCETCGDGHSALQRLCKSKFEGIVIDYKGEPDASRIVTAVHNSTSHRVAITFAIVVEEQRTEAFRAGFHFILSRPVESKSLRRTLRAAFPLLVQERRRYFRANLDVPVILHSARAGKMKTKSINISEGGMALACELCPAVGEKVSLEFQLPGTAQAMAVNAEVCWTKEQMVGVQFQRVPAAISGSLKSWLLERLEKTIPELDRVSVQGAPANPPAADSESPGKQ